ncbi:hypothetical protein WJX73_009289 [Symbiochloris irregularis]|uniref:Uncharacterized protein n=1 Tax=Symbiochloris irregularis TaxID=706552 RepID=A0AAW1NQ34_9CHLO
METNAWRALQNLADKLQGRITPEEAIHEPIAAVQIKPQLDFNSEIAAVYAREFPTLSTSYKTNGRPLFQSEEEESCPAPSYRVHKNGKCYNQKPDKMALDSGRSKKRSGRPHPGSRKCKVARKSCHWEDDFSIHMAQECNTSEHDMSSSDITVPGDPAPVSTPEADDTQTSEEGTSVAVGALAKRR